VEPHWHVAFAIQLYAHTQNVFLELMSKSFLWSFQHCAVSSLSHWSKFLRLESLSYFTIWICNETRQLFTKVAFINEFKWTNCKYNSYDKKIWLQCTIIEGDKSLGPCQLHLQRLKSFSRTFRHVNAPRVRVIDMTHLSNAFSESWTYWRVARIRPAWAESLLIGT